jgi:oligo-1,6-glucosidase
VNENYPDVTVEAELKSDAGVLRMWRDMIQMRREHEDAFVYGRFGILDLANEELFIYTKKGGKDEVFVVLNFTSSVQAIPLPEAPKGNRWDNWLPRAKTAVIASVHGMEGYTP